MSGAPFQGSLKTFHHKALGLQERMRAQQAALALSPPIAMVSPNDKEAIRIISELNISPGAIVDLQNSEFVVHHTVT